MPRTKLDEPVKVDWVKAGILERKLALKLEWADIAAKAHCNPDHLRALVSKKHTDDWNPEIRRAVCRALGLSIKTTLSVVTDSGVELD